VYLRTSTSSVWPQISTVPSGRGSAKINDPLPCRIVTLRPSQAGSLTAWAPVASSSSTPTRGANTRARNKLASSSF
jgi:hypothetical protein